MAKLGGDRRFVMDHAYWGPQFARMTSARCSKHTDQNFMMPMSVEQISDETELVGDRH